MTRRFGRPWPQAVEVEYGIDHPTWAGPIWFGFNTALDVRVNIDQAYGPGTDHIVVVRETRKANTEDYYPRNTHRKEAPL